MQLIFLPFSAHPPISDENSVLPKLTSVIWESIALKNKNKKEKKKESSQSSQKASEEVFLKGKLNNLEIFLFHILFTEVIFYNFVLLFFSLSIFLLVILACVEFVFSVLASPVG